MAIAVGRELHWEVHQAGTVSVVLSSVCGSELLTTITLAQATCLELESVVTVSFYC